MEIILTDENNKLDILNTLTKQKKLNPYKFYTFDDLKRNLYFDYDYEAIAYIIKKYNVNIDIAKIYLENMYFIKNINSEKGQFLLALKKELEEQKLLIKNEIFLNYIQNKVINVYGYEYLSKKEQKILENLNYSLFKMDEKIYDPLIYEANDVFEEVEFVANKIKALVHQKVDINNIKIIASQEYNKYLEYYFRLFDLPINIEYNNSFFCTIVAQEFLKLYNDFSIEEIVLKLREKYDVSTLITIINKSAAIQDKDVRLKFIVEDFKKTYVKRAKYKNAIEIKKINEYYNENNYVFLLGFNINSYPKIYKDDDYFTDEEKALLDLDTSVEKNKQTKISMLRKLRRIPNLTITYKLFSENGPCYPSILIESLQIKPKMIINDKTLSYSKKFSNICYAKALDELYKFNTEDKYLSLYQNNLNIPYREYNNKFKPIDSYLLKEKLSEGLVLSYTSLESFNECSFKYYISKILGLDIYEESFKTIIGNITHHILEIGLTNDLNIEESIINYVQNLDFPFQDREYFYLHKLAEELNEVLNYLKSQAENSSLNNYLFETDLEVYKRVSNIDITLKGIIDKVMYTLKNGREIIAVVDYKTGEKSVKLDTLEYGLNIQLPIYLYLLKKSNRFQNSVIAGFYLERVLNNILPINKEKDMKTLKEDNLRLQGYSNSDEEIIKLIDTNYQDSKMIKGLRFKKDGSFYNTAKILSSDQMDDLIIKVDDIINECINKIIQGNFSINPKIIANKNYSCPYCKFKDICYKQKDDEIKLGEYDNEVDS